MKKLGRERRHLRIAKKIKGDEQKPRLVVFRSKKNFYTQLINDDSHRVMLGISTLSKEFKERSIKSGNKEAAKELGVIVSKKALALGIKKVRFDRCGYKYHGRVKSFADGAREGGLLF